MVQLKGRWIGRSDVEFGAEISRISKHCGHTNQSWNYQQVGKKTPTNSLVHAGRDPGNRHIGASLGNGLVASEDYYGVQCSAG